MDRGRYYREHAVPLQGEAQGDEAGHAQRDEEEGHHVDLSEAVKVHDDVHHVVIGQQDVVTAVPAECKVHDNVHIRSNSNVHIGSNFGTCSVQSTR